MAVVRPIRVYLLDFFCSGIQFYVLLSPYLCFISILYLDLYVFGDDALIKYLTDLSKVVLLLRNMCVFVSCVSHAFASVHCCLAVTCWERADLLALVGDVYCIFVTFPCGSLGQVWYLII